MELRLTIKDEAELRTMTGDELEAYQQELTRARQAIVAASRSATPHYDAARVKERADQLTEEAELIRDGKRSTKPSTQKVM